MEGNSEIKFSQDDSPMKTQDRLFREWCLKQQRNPANRNDIPLASSTPMVPSTSRRPNKRNPAELIAEKGQPQAESRNDNSQVSSTTMSPETSRRPSKCFPDKLKADTRRAQPSVTPAPAMADSNPTTGRQDIRKELPLEGDIFGLPESVVQRFLWFKRIDGFHEWQTQMLESEAVAERRNLVLSMPTSGGKTLVAEMMILQELIIREKGVIFILPFVSIVQEKVVSLSKFAREFGFQVEEYADRKGVFPPVCRRHKRIVYVATMEKAAGLVDSMLEHDRLAAEIGLVCVDELHFIGEARGDVLEGTLTKVLHSKLKIQIMGMSATIGNMEEMCAFLKAEPFVSNFRPTQITEHAMSGNRVSIVQPSGSGSPLKIKQTFRPQASDREYLCMLVSGLLQKGPVLIFCASRANAETVASSISESLRGAVVEEAQKQSRSALMKALRVEADGRLCPVLGATIVNGVAYHHAGLTNAERKLLEEAYREGTVSCLTCTSTLSTGVNLPARSVIIRSPKVGSEFLSTSQYRQMIGRAGRARDYPDGESYLVFGPKETSKVIALLQAPLGPCKSRFEDASLLPTFLLSTLCVRLTSTREQLTGLLGSSLYAVTSGSTAGELAQSVDDALQVLATEGAINLSTEGATGCTIKVTPLGLATFRGHMSLKTATQLRRDLQQAGDGMNLRTHIHRLFLVTPYNRKNQDIYTDATCYYNTYASLDDKERKACEIIGVDFGVVIKFYKGKRPADGENRNFDRLYQCLILYSLWKNKPVWEVAEQFKAPRGKVTGLQSSAASFAASVIRFSEVIPEFNWVGALLVGMPEQIANCSCSALLPLMKIPYFRMGRARQFVSVGLTTLRAVADADVEDLIRRIDYLSRRLAGDLISHAKFLLQNEDGVESVPT